VPLLTYYYNSLLYIVGTIIVYSLRHHSILQIKNNWSNLEVKIALILIYNLSLPNCTAKMAQPIIIVHLYVA